MPRLALCVLLVAMLVGGRFSARAVGAEQPTPAPVRISLDTRIDGENEVTTRVVARVPLDGRWARVVRKLRATPTAYSEAYREALEDVFKAGGVLDDSQASAIVGVGLTLPRLRIDGDSATLTALAPTTTLWGETEDDKELILSGLDIPAHTHFSVSLHTPGSEPEFVRPLPTEDDGDGELRWEFHSGSFPDLEVGLAEPLRAGQGFSEAIPLLGTLVGALPFLVLLGMAVGRRTNDFRPQPDLILLALAGLVLAVVGAAYYLYQDLNESQFGDTRRAVVALLAVPGILAFVMAPRGGRVVRGLLAGLASVGFAVAVALHPHVREIGFVADGGLSEPQFIFAGLLGMAMFAFVVAATVRWLWEAWPSAPTGRGAPRWLTAVVPSATALAAGLHFVLAARGQHALFGFDLSREGWLDRLELFLETFPIQLSGLARNAALTMLGIGIAIWLWNRAAEGDLPFRRWRECLAVALLVATAVIGVGGEIDGYPVPIAFLLAVAGTAALVRLLGASSRARLVSRASAKHSASSLLDLAIRLAALRRQRHATSDKFGDGEIDHDAYEQQLRELDRKRATEADVPALAGLASEDRPRAALAIGLGGEGGGRSRWRTVLRRGWWIVAVPMAYSAYVLVDLNLGEALPYPVSPAFVVAAVFDQAAMWPIAVWAFLLVAPLIPGSIGPLKGLAVGLFLAAPPAIASLVIDDSPGADQWLFVSAELTLLLIAVGVLLDYHAVRRAGGDIRRLGDLYSITSMRAGLAYLAPLGILLLSVIQGLANGSGASALGELVTNASSLLPPH